MNLDNLKKQNEKNKTTKDGEITAANSHYADGQQGSTSSTVLLVVGVISIILGVVGFFFNINIASDIRDEDTRMFYYIVACVNLISGVFVMALINVLNAIYDKLYKVN